MSARRARLAPETDSVMRFYDEVGWQSDGDDAFRDAELFEDLRPVSRDYIHRCHLRVNRYLAPRGAYLLDVASGPLQYPEYLTYSQGYDVRICADVSLTALRASKEKLGDRGAFVQCDITRLPFKDSTVDGFVSLHTIYHVPAEAQADAFTELERVLKSEKTGVVVYNWGRHCVAMTLLASRIPRVDDVPRLLRRVIPGAFSEGQKGGPGLYYHSHDYRWFARAVASRGGWRVAVWRSVSVPFLRRYMHPRHFGQPLLAALFRLEDAFPNLLGRYGQYPLMVYRRPARRRIQPGRTE